MHRLVVDTNVIISSFLSAGNPRNIIRELIIPTKVTLLISIEVKTEYRQVIGYKKFEKYPLFQEESKITIENILSLAEQTSIKHQFDLLPDYDDNKFLDLAYAGKADFLITGNTRHFPIKKFYNTTIISPQKYWNTYWS